MEFLVLGNLEAVRDGQRVELGAFRQRALLALLLTAPNAVLSTDRILDELWGTDGGPDKQNALWVYVSGLRKALEPERARRTEGTILLTRAPGYLLHVGNDDIDALRFERMVAEGRGLVEVDPAAAALVLGEALALWRGRAFEDFTYEPFAQAEIARLEELRLEAVELRVDADLARGLARELISELESLVRQHPLKERLTGQLMVALYRSSRQAEALRAYQMLKSRLGEELGIEPTTALHRMEEQIVTGDEALQPRSPLRVSATPTGPGPAVRGYELREVLGQAAQWTAYRAYQPAVGREVAIKVIRADLANDPGFIRRFQSDAQKIATLDHPHIVPLYDYWREPDAAYLVTPMLRGGTLASLLERGPLTTAHTLAMVDQVSDALGAAHRLGVVHGDVTADNVLLDDDGNAYLSNFGVAVGDGDVDPDSDIRSLGALVSTALTGESPEQAGPRLVLPDPVARVLDRSLLDDPAGRFDTVADLVSELHRAVLGAQHGSIARPSVERSAPVNPYKGLRAFDAVDALDFFGRERLVERLVARLGLSGTRGRFIAVVGPSGSGKSSAVKAGLLPAIRQGALPLSGTWFTIEMTPAPHPFEQLEDALLGVAVDPPSSLLEQLAGEQGMERAIDRVLPDDGSQLLLLIDQFEELFTQVDAATANRFIDSVVSAVTDPQSRVRVVVTLRADFYDRPLHHRGLGELLREGTEIITPMSPVELERAITRPAESHGVTFEPALIAELLREVTDRPGALPLLQYTLTELFDGRSGTRIDFAAYEALGGMSSSLVKRAEGLLSGLGNGAANVARQVFLRLVTVSDGGEDTRRRVLKSELEELEGDRQPLRSVLDTFGRHRLLSFDRDPVSRSPTVEISHEALLTEWTRLRNWIDGARADVRMQRRLAEAMREWVAAGRADAYLLRGGLLDQMTGWTTMTSVQLSGPERAFLAGSVAERDREAREMQDRERRAVTAERRQVRRSHQLLVVGLVAILVAALAVFGTAQWRSAVDAKRDVEDLLAVDGLVRASEDAGQNDPELALLLAMQAVRLTADDGYATGAAVDAVHFGLQELGVSYDVDPETPVAVRAGPSGLVGVYALPPAELMRLAESAVERSLTDDECRTYLSRPCPAEADIPINLELQGGLEAYGARTGPDALRGTTITIAAPYWVEDAATAGSGLNRELAAFSDRTGIAVEVTAGDVAANLGTRPDELSRRPDVVSFGGVIPDWVEERAIDISTFVAPETLRSDFGDYLLSFGSSASAGRSIAEGAPVRALPLALDVKGLVFYPKAKFEEAGYAIPKSWDQLIALSDQIVADGGAPWCFAFASGDGSGWPGTDLIESLVLRVGGTDTYDAWAAGEIGFTSPPVMEAGRLADELVFGPAYARGGAEAISGDYFADQLQHVLARNGAGEIEPECWLHQASKWALTYTLPAGARIGTDIDYFMLPPIDPSEPVPLIGNPSFASGLVDRPEVRAFMEFAASPQWGREWAASISSDFTSANARFDVSTHGDSNADPEAAIRTELAGMAHSALHAGVLRVDGSDAMPTEIGGITAEGVRGPVFRGMVDWVDGVRTIDQVFADIDAEWAALKAREADAGAGP